MMELSKMLSAPLNSFGMNKNWHLFLAVRMPIQSFSFQRLYELLGKLIIKTSQVSLKPHLKVGMGAKSWMKYCFVLKKKPSLSITHCRKEIMDSVGLVTYIKLQLFCEKRKKLFRKMQSRSFLKEIKMSMGELNQSMTF